MSNTKVAAVIVTFNKLDLFKECLTAIRAQTTPVSHIVVVDNHSTDDTQAFLATQKDLIVIRTESNLGGAGGFNTGMKAFMNRTQDDAVWIMDDDTIPTATALEKMLAAGDKVDDYGFLCSNVKWIDQKPSIMNVPNVSRKDWNWIAEKGLISVESCSFVSVMIPRKIVQRVGYPISDFFIWGDDFEYTLRITTIGDHEHSRGYFVGDSVTIHKMKQNLPVDILHEENPNRLGRFFYNYRNVYYISKQEGRKYWLLHIATSLNTFFKVPFKSPNKRLKRMGLILKGLFAGVGFHPKIEQVEND